MTTTKLMCALLLVVVASHMRCEGRARGRRHRNSFSLLNSANSMEDKEGNSKVDAFGSWNNFLGHTANTRNNKKSKSKNKAPVSQGPAVVGPPGPPGPPGPQGPAGAIVTEASMMTEFRNLVRESAEKRSRRLAEFDQNISLMAAGTPDLLTAFHIELRGDVQIPRKTLHELGNYRTHIGHYGTFVRGNDVDFKSGRYIVRYTGIYQFTANIHVLRPRDANLRPRDNIKLRICITSLCNHNTSLMTIIGLNTNSKIFTTSLTGMLHLKAGQYVSVFVENSSGNPIIISSQSTFTGILLGA
ncbi:adipolin isoform X2 [Nematostella vectensis]|uniref:adipolin isoform X2 n=1 Tax=Nematostella vectensis TaxID=45351 RepID=UPI0020773452|nr:adipolin isoform X2 [Nematostella vectensis]